jgi:hypothetical protein
MDIRDGRLTVIELNNVILQCAADCDAPGLLCTQEHDRADRRGAPAYAALRKRRIG